TEYFQKWCSFWFDEAKRLKVAKFFQQQRCRFIQQSWKKLPALTTAGIMPDTLIESFHEDLARAKDNQQLMGYEANFSKALYKILAENSGNTKFSRQQGKNDPFDLFNSYLDHGNYLAYGLAASVLWVLGISHSMPVSHGFTRRGALVFDVADMVKDGAILPNAFAAAAAKKNDQAMRDQCISFLDETDALKFMFTQVKSAIEIGVN
ncbi:MAG: type I-F CRISPR-associated endonuclease Cas1, partial [Desulfamplus sp.]|nr:type I-F CRISPR-associated endonuclease Cas1 [Desulfamplus sp.]